MNVRALGFQVLDMLREQGRAGMNTGISNPVPLVQEGKVVLVYLLQNAIFQAPFQIEYEPYARLTVDYQTGELLGYQALPTGTPAEVIGRYPHAAARTIPIDQWDAVWEEFYGLYPSVINQFAGVASDPQLAVGRDDVVRFKAVWVLLTPPYMERYYQSLNPAFFAWLAGAA